jgi:hypothetical protein
LSFFKTVPFQLKQQCKLLFNEVGHNKGLAGFNQPTPAKVRGVFSFPFVETLKNCSLFGEGGISNTAWKSTTVAINS